jgi:hypothetical protein
VRWIDFILFFLIWRRRSIDQPVDYGVKIERLEGVLMDWSKQPFRRPPGQENIQDPDGIFLNLRKSIASSFFKIAPVLAMDLLLALILIIFSSYYTIKPQYVKDEADAFGKMRSFSSFIALSIFIETLLIKTTHSFFQPRLVILNI